MKSPFTHPNRDSCLVTNGQTGSGGDHQGPSQLGNLWSAPYSLYTLRTSRGARREQKKARNPRIVPISQTGDQQPSRMARRPMRSKVIDHGRLQHFPKAYPSRSARRKGESSGKVELPFLVSPTCSTRYRSPAPVTNGQPGCNTMTVKVQRDCATYGQAR